MSDSMGESASLAEDLQSTNGLPSSPMQSQTSVQSQSIEDGEASTCVSVSGE